MEGIIEFKKKTKQLQGERAKRNHNQDPPAVKVKSKPVTLTTSRHVTSRHAQIFL